MLYKTKLKATTDYDKQGYGGVSEKKTTVLVILHSYCWWGQGSCGILWHISGHIRHQIMLGEPQQVCSGFMGPPVVHLGVLAISQLFLPVWVPGEACRGKPQSQRAGPGHGAPNGSGICVIPIQTWMNGQAALCGDVLISSALTMNRQKVVQRANNAGDWQEGTEKVQNVLVCCRVVKKLWACVHNVSRLTCT